MAVAYGTLTKKNQIQELEKVQKNAARFVINDYTFVSGRTSLNFKKLGWISLEEQRARIKITTFYKGINELTTIPVPLNQHQTNPDRRSTRQSGYQTYSLPASSVDSHLYSFFPSTLRLWNKLPLYIKSNSDIDTFKNALQFTTLKTAAD